MATLPENVSQLSKMIPKPEKDVGCQILIQMPGVSRHGFLRKMPDSRGGRLFDSVLNRRWSSKFVILRAGCVYIYSSETSTNYDRANSLFGFQDVLPCTSDVYKAGKWIFQVVDALKDQDRDRSMYFSASSESDMKEWIDVIQKEICQGNLAVFSPSSSHEKAKPKPSVNMRVMPRIPEELREKMRRSIALEKNINICHEGQESSSGSESDEHDPKPENKPKRPLPVPPVPLPSIPAPITKEEIAAVKPFAKPLPRPGVSEKPRPVPPKPPGQNPPLTSAKPAKQNPPVTSPKSGLQKPTNPVKPLPAQPSIFPKPSNANFKERMVPQPPGLKELPQTSQDKFVGDYEGGIVYADTAEDEYEIWVPGEEGMNDPLIKASYWTEEAEKALQVILSIDEDGVFLIRDASEGFESKTLMVCTSEVEKNVRKYRITKDTSHKYSLQLGKSGFQSLQELVQYYQKNSLPNRTVKLTKPYSEVWKPR